MSQSKSKAAPAASTVHPAKAPAVPKTTTRLRTPSITTSLLAATVTDHPPVVQISASTAAPLTGAASVAESIPSTQPIQPAAGSSTPAATPPATSYGVPAPPDVVIPSPAPGFFPEPLRHLSGSSPTKTQLAAMTSAIQDLGSFGDSADVLGPLAPAAAAVAGALNLGLQWRALRAPTIAWDVRAHGARPSLECGHDAHR